MIRSPVVALVVIVTLPSVGRAHTFAPGMLDLKADREGNVLVSWTTSTTGRKGEAAVEGLRPVLPEHCQLGTPQTLRQDDRFVTSFSAHCGTQHATVAIRIAHLNQTKLSVFVRATTPDGAEHVSVLGGADDTYPLALVVNTRVPQGNLFERYFTLGVDHIATGYDHLAFLLCLLLIVRRPRAVIAAVTAFTVAHAITISLTTLSAFSPPPRPTEALIAATIVLVALQVVHRRSDLRTLWAEVFVFGLLHGMGFAGALRQTGIPEDGLWQALLMFNVGIEIGQLIFVMIAFTALGVLRRVLAHHEAVVTRTLAYAAGTAGMFWFFDRTLAIVLR